MRKTVPIVLLVALALAARFLPGPRTIDDAFITFRYARHLVSGVGFVYNPGERVLGTTTPLYTLLLTTISLFTGRANAPFPEIALTLNAWFDAATCLMLWDLGRRWGSRWAGWGAALVWALAPYSVTFAVGGLETSLYVFSLTAAALAYTRTRYAAAALAAALALLTRPDALLLIGPLAVDRGLRALRDPHARPSLREIALFVLPLLAWGIFATAYFGSPLPHSIHAKAQAYRLSPEAALTRLLQHYATPFLGHLTFGIPWIGVGLVLYPTLTLIGARRALQHNPRTWPFLLFPWVYFAAFAIANPLIFRWYLTPPLPFYFLAILIGADRLVRALLARVRPPDQEGQPLTRSAMALLVVLVPLALSAQDWTLKPDHGIRRPAPEMAWYRLELTYRQAARILADDLSPNTVLAAGDVGVLGYYTGARILDTVGLNSPEAVDYYPADPDIYVINYAVAPDLILDHEPDLVVLLEVYGREGLFEDPRFLSEYDLAHEIPSDIYSSDGMQIYAREGGS